MTDRNWNRDDIQFARLLSEIRAAGGLTRRRLDDVCESMDLKPVDVQELFDRADRAWDHFKRTTRP